MRSVFRVGAAVARPQCSRQPFGTAARAFSTITLPADSNQARGIAEYALEMVSKKHHAAIDASVWKKVEMFHTDSVMCGISALALKTNAPTILRAEALEYGTTKGATVFGNNSKCAPEKAIAANSAAVREWDSNGTVFGFNSNIPGHNAGEFGHNDFYPVVIAAAQMRGDVDGTTAMAAMIALDEIRGRLAEVFSLKSYKIDHVVHGAIASAAVYGALMGGTVDQIESAIGMTVAHYVPFRAIRAGKQLSDSKGSSAALSTEAAILSTRRALNGFLGPRDIFRNPESIFRLFEPTTGATASDKNSVDLSLANKARWGEGPSPFNLVLSTGGSDFAVCGMHFKLGLYEHQSAGALEGVLNLLLNSEKDGVSFTSMDDVKGINIVAYEPAYGIIGDPAKRNPTTRQSADHSMAFIVSRMLQKVLADAPNARPKTMDEMWKKFMLAPADYGKDALYNDSTRGLMQRITFEHGGPEYDSKYPEGIPTTMQVTHSSGKVLESGFVMFPTGHARNTTADLNDILEHKHRLLGSIAIADDKELTTFITRLQALKSATPAEVCDCYNFSALKEHQPID